MQSRDIVHTLMMAAVTVARSHPHYGAYLLGEMAKHGQLELLRLHTTGTGDRMVVRYARDSFHVYEVVLTPFRPEELADDEFMSRHQQQDVAPVADPVGVVERI